MTATISKNLKGSYLAWCDKCQDGLRGTENRAREWQLMHNNKNHPA